MKVSQLKQAIKQIVRQSINEMSTPKDYAGDNDHMRQMQEVAPPGFGPGKQHADIYNKLMHQYKGSPEKAYATMWSIHNKISEITEAALQDGYEMDEAGLTSEKKDKWIQKAVDPSHKGYCTPMTKSTCTPRRKALAKRFKKGIDENGAEGHEEHEHEHESKEEKLIQMLHKVTGKLASMHKGVNEASYKTVAQTQLNTQKDDQARKVQHEPKVNEASYKVVAPRQARVQKDDQARKMQTDPKMNEASYKTQGPSAKTFKDSPQFPKASGNPKNA
jgi:hypothetical protein